MFHVHGSNDYVKHVQENAQRMHRRDGGEVNITTGRVCRIVYRYNARDVLVARIAATAYFQRIQSDFVDRIAST